MPKAAWTACYCGLLSNVNFCFVITIIWLLLFFFLIILTCFESLSQLGLFKCRRRSFKWLWLHFRFNWRLALINGSSAVVFTGRGCDRRRVVPAPGLRSARAGRSRGPAPGLDSSHSARTESTCPFHCSDWSYKSCRPGEASELRQVLHATGAKPETEGHLENKSTSDPWLQITEIRHLNKAYPIFICKE